MASTPPARLAIDHDDYVAQHVGRTSDGRQFFLTTPFVPAIHGHAGREFIALYVFDAAGRFLEAHIDDLGPRVSVDTSAAQQIVANRLKTLGNVTFCRIEVSPFSVEQFGTTFGLVPRPPEDDDDDSWWGDAHPGNNMAFHEPWDSGEYDT